MTAALPPTDANALREEIARLRAELEKYQGHEPTVRKEMAYIRSENDRLDDLLERARAVAVALEQENARLRELASTLADRWAELADGMAASLATGELDDAIEYVRTGRELVFRSAARDLRWLIANDTIPHWLMTSEELGEPELSDGAS